MSTLDRKSPVGRMGRQRRELLEGGGARVDAYLNAEEVAKVDAMIGRLEARSRREAIKRAVALLPEPGAAPKSALPDGSFWGADVHDFVRDDAHWAAKGWSFYDDVAWDVQGKGRCEEDRIAREDVVRVASGDLFDESGHPVQALEVALAEWVAQRSGACVVVRLPREVASDPKGLELVARALRAVHPDIEVSTS